MEVLDFRAMPVPYPQNPAPKSVSRFIQARSLAPTTSQEMDHTQHSEKVKKQ